MKFKILIMGLPGSGKTTLASKLKPLIEAQWLNADAIRKSENDWVIQSSRSQKARAAVPGPRGVVSAAGSSCQRSLSD